MEIVRDIANILVHLIDLLHLFQSSTARVVSKEILDSMSPSSDCCHHS